MKTRSISFSTFDDIEYPMFTIRGKSVTVFVAYMAIFVDPYLLVEHLLTHAEGKKVFLRFNGNILASILCLLEVFYELLVKVRRRIVVLIHLLVVLEVQ